MEKFIYNQNNKDRIDNFLAANFEYSRNFFHHILKRNGVLVNGKPVKKSYKLKENDEIQIDNLKRYLDSDYLSELPFVKIPIVFEKEDYLVINKPYGVLSHPNSIWDLSCPSVVAWVYQNYKNVPSIGNFIRAGLVHRLDKDTNGLMIIAKTERALHHFKTLFQKKSLAPNIEEKEKIPLQKYYKAKVEITQEGESFLNYISLPHYIQEIVKPKVSYIGEYKMGITKITKIEGNNIYLQILTGRTHQIRYHLSNKGLPVIGDKLYGKLEENGEGKQMQLSAYRLTFNDTDGEFIDIKL